MSGTDEFTTTPNLGLKKPNYDADAELWGYHINENADLLDQALGPVGTYVPFTGGEMRGALALAGVSTAPTPAPGTTGLQVVNADFLHSEVASVPTRPGSVVSDSPPVLPAGGLWWSSLDGQLYVRYDDGNSLQYVPATSAIPAGMASKADVVPTLNNVGRNLLHNPLMDIFQRGSGPWTDKGTRIDRWFQFFGGANTITTSRVVLTDTDRLQIGDEAARGALQYAFVGGPAASDRNSLSQVVENVYRLAGKTVTFSFWARCVGAPFKVGLNISQVCGAGGSGTLWAQPVGNSITLTPNWVRYSTTIAMPSMAGRVIGPNGDDSTNPQFLLSSGSDNDAVYGHVGIQSGTLQIWGVQIEVGSVATPLDKPDRHDDLARCQRFYSIGVYNTYGYQAAGGYITQMIALPVAMRSASITVAYTPANTDPNVSLSYLDVQSNYQLRHVVMAAATGPAAASGQFSASAELG